MLLGTTQVESRKLMRLIAMVCIVLALFVAGLEATHSHSEAAVAQQLFSLCYLPVRSRECAHGNGLPAAGLPFRGSFYRPV